MEWNTVKRAKETEIDTRAEWKGTNKQTNKQKTPNYYVWFK